MQHNAAEHLPQVIKDYYPSGNYISIPGLNDESIERIISKNSTNLNLPENTMVMKELTHELINLTCGNPLHLKYVLSELKNKNGNRLITKYSLDSLIPYGGGIEDYYQMLWRQLSDEEKSLLYTISCVNFKFTQEQLIECVSEFESDAAGLSNNYKNICHLYKKDNRDRISIYHNSFELFLLAQPDFKIQKTVLKKNIKDWLLGCSYEHLKWAELRKD